jgi:carbohydrate-selective porin OprB
MKEEPTLKRRAVTMFLAMAFMIVAAGLGIVAAEEEPAPIVDAGSGGSASASSTTPSAPTPGWLERDTLTGDWGGLRLWLAEHGITLKPRVSLFSQGLTSGAGPDGFEFGGKTDLMLNFDLSKLGFWNGLSLTIHNEYNFGESVNQRGGTLIPVNTALQFPGIKGADRFDVSSF